MSRQHPRIPPNWWQHMTPGFSGNKDTQWPETTSQPAAFTSFDLNYFLARWCLEDEISSWNGPFWRGHISFRACSSSFARAITNSNWNTFIWVVVSNMYFLFLPRSLGRWSMWRAYFFSDGWFSHQPIMKFSSLFDDFLILKGFLVCFFGVLGNERAQWWSSQISKFLNQTCPAIVLMPVFLETSQGKPPWDVKSSRAPIRQQRINDWIVAGDDELGTWISYLLNGGTFFFFFRGGGGCESLRKDEHALKFI